MTFAIIACFSMWVTKSFIACTVEFDGARNKVWEFAIMFTRTLSIVVISLHSGTREFLFSRWICADLGNRILNDANNRDNILKYLVGFSNCNYRYWMSILLCRRRLKCSI